MVNIIKKAVEKVRFIFHSFNLWRWKRNNKRMYKTLERIRIEMPELSTTYHHGSTVHYLTPQEQIKTYYELKGIKSQRINNWIIVVLTAVIILLTWSTLKFQKNSSAPLDPSLDFKITRNIFANYNLIGFANMGNDTFMPNRPVMDLWIVNRGQSNTGPIAYRLMEANHRFYVSNDNNPPVAPLDMASTTYSLLYWNCSMVQGINAYKKAVKESCNPDFIQGGLIKWYLVVDCPACRFDKNPKCYSFNICVYNSTQNEKWCKDLLGNSDFVPTECPDPFY